MSGNASDRESRPAAAALDAVLAEAYAGPSGICTHVHHARTAAAATSGRADLRRRIVDVNGGPVPPGEGDCSASGFRNRKLSSQFLRCRAP